MVKNTLGEMEEIKVKKIDSIYPAFLNEKAVHLKQGIIKNLLKIKNTDYHSADYDNKLDLFSGLVKSCKRCKLSRECKIPIPPDIVYQPKAMFVGRNPGKIDDIVGVPFSQRGNSGKIFSKYLDVLGLSREEVILSNVAYCRTKTNRPPEMEHMQVCSLWKYWEFRLFKTPPFIFVLGNDALKLFMGWGYPSLLAIHGDIYHTFLAGKKEVYIIPVNHPSFILRNREWGKDTVKILRFVKQELME